jgi:hypothetical protein
MGGWTIHKVTCRRVQASVTWIQLNVHHIPTFKVNVAGLPFLAFLVTAENKTTLGCSYEDHYLFAHDRLLSSKTEKVF